MSRTDLQTLPERAVELLGGEPDDTTLRRYLHGLPGVDAVGLEQRAAGLGTRSIKTTSKAWALDKIIELIDLTTLEGADTPGKVRSLVAKALNPDAADPTCPRVAAVCVYGDMVPHAVEALGAAHGDPDDGLVSVAAVATAFPSGRASLEIKLADTADAVAAGADEIDMVIDRGAFLAGRYGLVFDQIARVKEACRRAGRHVRVAQGHPRDRRAQHLRQRQARVVARDPRGRRLHQDLDRQGAAGGDPAGDAAHARGRARLAPRDRREDRREAGRRHPHLEGRHQVPRDRRRDGGRGVAAAAPVPVRGIEPAERRADAAPEAGERALLRRRLRDDRLTGPTTP